jgi:hypothetical protein
MRDDDDKKKMKKKRRRNPPLPPPPHPRWILSSPSAAVCLTHLLVGIVCFHAGLILGSSHQLMLLVDNNGMLDCPTRSRVVGPPLWPSSLSSSSFRRRRNGEQQQLLSDNNNNSSSSSTARSREDQQQQREWRQRRRRLFPSRTLGHLFAGMARVNRTDFAALVDVGVPLLESYRGNSEVLVLYGSEDSFPGYRGEEDDDDDDDAAAAAAAAARGRKDRNRSEADASGDRNGTSTDDGDDDGDDGVLQDDSLSGNRELSPFAGGGGADAGEVDGGGSSILAQVDNATFALENCLAVRVVLFPPRKPRECLAVVGQWEDYHLHLFRRVPPEQKMRKKRGPNNNWREDGRPATKADTTPSVEHPLRYVGRGVSERGEVGQGLGVPTKSVTKAYHKDLIDYLARQQETLQRLAPVVQLATGGRGTGRTVVVMLVNRGQSSLFQNFVCSARSRDLDLSNVVLFATDPDAAEIARAMNVRVFEVRDAFGVETMPREAAQRYGDVTFKRMMMAKVYCVHLVLLLGYNVLFQDVDVTWRKHPVEYFREHQSRLQEFDMIAQDDGARSIRYAPWSFNTGLYFVRCTPRTVFFFDVFSRMGDVVLKYRSHQAAMIALLGEHASWMGLRVKILERDSTDGMLFPGGYHFHRRWDYMKQVVQGRAHPYLFHMSWTESMGNKVRFLKQLGEWYVDPDCENNNINRTTATTTGVTRNKDAPPTLPLPLCCLAEPVVECHYRDKPSKIPCRDSPAMDHDGESFW